MYYDMGKGVMLKKKGGENIYPVTASDLVYDPITKKNVKEELGGKVEEAPKNDKQYARVNGSWAEVEAGAVSEVALITLTPAVAELNGVSVKVTTNEGETLLDTTWNGAQLSVQVRAGLQYTVAVGSKEGFIAPQAVTYTAVKGATRSINMAYTESRLKVNILSNQGSDSDISSVKATVKYGSASVQVANGGRIALPLNVAVTITFPDVTGYKKPETISYTHTSGSYEKSGTYETEIVSVTLSADNGQSVNGQKVTINGTQHTWNGTAITQKVAFGTKYTVSVNDKDGYTKPVDNTFTASQQLRQVSMIYGEIEFGAYVQGVSGKLYKYGEWSGQEEACGVAVVNENFSCVLSPSFFRDGISIGATGDIVSNLPIVYEAYNDFDGLNNTKKIKASIPSTDFAAGYCLNCKNKREKSGYLGSAGEMFTILEETENFGTLYIELGGSYSQLEKNYRTSTRCEDYSDGSQGFYGIFNRMAIKSSIDSTSACLPLFPL